MSAECQPFLPEPEPDPAPPQPKKAARKTLLLWVLLILMFLAIWQFLSPAPGAHPTEPQLPPCESSFWTVQTTLFFLGAVAFALLIFLFTRAYRASREFNLAQEPGRRAVAEGRLADAVGVFSRLAAAHAKQPLYESNALLAAGRAQTLMGDLDGALATYRSIEKKRAAFFTSGVRTVAAAHLACVHALAGSLDAAKQWAAETRARLGKNRDDRMQYGAHLCLAEAMIAIRQGRATDAVSLLERDWLVLREVLTCNTMRTVEVVRAFAEAGGGMREYNKVSERLVRIEPVCPGEFAFLGVKWPEMRAFLQAHLTPPMREL